ERATDHTLLLGWAMTCVYSDGEPPLDVETGAVREDVFAQWLAWDPVLMGRTERFGEALRRMRAIWIDAGLSDEDFLDLGAVAFRDTVRAAGVPDERVFFELHEGRHSGNGWRLPLALSWLAERLAV